MTTPLDFQSMIIALQRYWAEHGCLIAQPYNHQVGAGTMNPATFLRVLGPEPWNVAYVEPSVRPDDGRYGDNPYRLAQHTQFQVILKPDPGNPQELYLDSLAAIGIDPRRHDIRFVEDNWESPALGAWGLGWEVWLDGQEITQFTYFQQAGGMPCDPVAVEITYGLERIAMPLQRVRHFRDIRYNGSRTLGDIFYQGEKEHSTYYFETADVTRLQQMYKLYEEEAMDALSKGLILPAYDYLLKCSHTFNVLDTRGAVGVTERQALFARMRDMARRISESYVAHRQELEFPWLTEASETEAVEIKPVKAQALTAPADFLLEIGTEELPAADLQAALTQLRDRVPALLDELRLVHGEVSILGTPRRLVVIVKDLAEAQPDRTSLVKGPPASRAFDAMGVPTKAAEGFAASKGLSVRDLKPMEIDGGLYVAAEVHEVGRSSVEVLAEALPTLVAGIKFDKAMRWNRSNVAFSRPIRWLLALHGSTLIPFTYAGMVSRAETHGLRFHTPETLPVDSLESYMTVLRQQGILLDPQERRTRIVEQVKALMTGAGGDAKLDENLLDEVTSLVEAPTALLGQFDPQRLALPTDVLTSVMKKYQRYFPVQKADGSLLPCFVAVRNGDTEHLDVVTDGNEQVIGARFADAAFFIKEDEKTTLEDLLPRSATLVFQAKLGSMRDRSERITALAEKLFPVVHVSESDQATLRRAARLCKADLVSHMVIEMTSLQGVMGRFYALRDGETAEVANTIYEHYLPRYAGDALPAHFSGAVLSLADRLDSLMGLFAAGLAPTGTKDPFALRRTAIGLVQLLAGYKLRFDMRQGLALAAESLPIPADAKVQQDCLDFITGRMRAWFLDMGFAYDVVDAVLAAQAHNPANALQAVAVLRDAIATPEWKPLIEAYARCVRISRDQPQSEVVAALLKEPSEIALLKQLDIVEGSARMPDSLSDFLTAFTTLVAPIHTFFEDVMVMTDDPALRASRIGILQRIAALPRDCADLSKLEGF
jgi:glycyl-tRNA synthetase